jgi:hypothetical protein
VFSLQGSGLGCMAGHAGGGVDGDHFELPADALELLRQVRPADQQWFIEEVTQALAVVAETKDFGPLQEVLEAWTVTVRLSGNRATGNDPADAAPRAWRACGSRAAASPSRLAPCAGGSSRPTSSGKRSSATATPSE